MEEGVPENDNWDGDSHTSQLPLPQISFQKLCHIIHREPPGFQLKGKSQTSPAQTTAALLWWLSTINSFLPERSPTLNSWKRITTEPRKELKAYPAQGLSLASHMKCAFCLLRESIRIPGHSCGHGRSMQQLDPRSDPSFWHQETCRGRKTETAQMELPFQMLVNVIRLAAFLWVGLKDFLYNCS